MSQGNREDRLLAEALADAMELDLQALTREPMQEHRFSGKFLRGMQELVRGQEDTRSARRRRSVLRLGGAAAALVCVLGLAVLTSGIRMGSTSSDAPGESAETTWEDASSADEAAADAADEAAEEAQPLAPTWQEQLLAESAKADELVSWHCDTEEDDEELIFLRSEMCCKQTVRISDVYEVYYESSPGEWTRVYHGQRVMQEYREGLEWEDGYLPADYNMTRSGSYRLVRQVGIYRQVIELRLQKK